MITIIMMMIGVGRGDDVITFARVNQLDPWMVALLECIKLATEFSSD